MNLTITIAIALKAIFTNKVRAFLTMLGVIIGVASVVLLIAIGEGLKKFITDQFNDLGANAFYIVPGNPLSGGFPNREQQLAAIASNKLRYTDVSKLRQLGQPITRVVAWNQTSTTASFGQNEQVASVLGTEPDYQYILNTSLQFGDFFTKADNQSKRRVAVIGHEIKTELFGDIDPIGKEIRLNGTSFKIVGLTEAKGASFGGPSFDNYIYIPIQTYFNLFDTNQILEIAVQVNSQDQINTAIDLVETDLQKRLEEDEFSVLEAKDILSVINQVLTTLTVALGGIAAISLVVGGIGIMNIMLVSVTERTREIGLRKALGATPRTILLQFLIESSVLSVLGGLIGLTIAFLLTLLISNFFPAYVTPTAVLLAFGVSNIIGIIFGVAPAHRASKLSPIEALRYE